MERKNVSYYDEATILKGYYAYPPAPKGKLTAVLVCPAWYGLDNFCRDKVDTLAEMGCLGFGVDVYGGGRTAKTPTEAEKLMNPLVENRKLIRSRLHAALNEVRNIPEVNPEMIGVIGFCFGGLCALELARSGADIKGTVSFHGLLHRDKALPINPIKSSVLVLHGFDDPMVSPDILNDFEKEMIEAQADWQIHIYGNTMHAFTNPQAQSPENGLLYNKTSAHRAWKSMKRFFRECFSEFEIPQAPLKG